MWLGRKTKIKLTNRRQLILRRWDTQQYSRAYNLYSLVLLFYAIYSLMHPPATSVGEVSEYFDPQKILFTC